MRRNSLRITSATLNYSSVLVSRLTKLGCRWCRTTLQIHQPNVDKPEQLLATCPGCGAWFRVEIRAGETHGVIISVPEAPTMGPGTEPIPNPTA